MLGRNRLTRHVSSRPAEWEGLRFAGGSKGGGGLFLRGRFLWGHEGGGHGFRLRAFKHKKNVST